MAIQKLGKWTSTSLVVGNMVGAGIFMMPALLGAYGGISVIGWLLSALGAIFIAILFSKLNKLAPGVQGGPYAYTFKGLGRFPAFLVAWGYWISVWTTNAALSVAFVSYLSVLIPALNENLVLSITVSLGIIWGLSWYNTLGIDRVGRMALLTTSLKLIPILAIGLWGIFLIELDYFRPLNLSGESSWKAILATVTLTFFSFLGIESATIPGESIDKPEKTISFATKWGTGIAIVVYILSSIAVMGLIPPEQLSSSGAPFADAANKIWGSGFQYVIAVAALISVFGALNGWILIQGQMPEAIARDNLFPKVFARENKNGVPFIGLFISSGLASILIVMNYSGGLLKVFEFMILVSTVSVLIPYVFCSFAYFVLVKKMKMGQNMVSVILISFLVSAFSIIALIGSGKDAIIWGIVFLLFGVPVYLFLLKGLKSKSKDETD